MYMKIKQLFYKLYVTKYIHIRPSNINKNLKINLLENLKDKVGNKCIKEGYVLKDSIKIVKYSAGIIHAAHFNGDIRYKIIYTAQIYNPVEKTEIICNIVNKNKMGILAEAGEISPAPISILVSKQHHNGKDIQELS